MAIKLMYITNKPEVANIAENAGVDRIFVDMEYIGKETRQGGMDTVQSHHTVEDVKNIRNCLKSAELLVRVNPIHEETEEYCSSEKEIEAVVEAGADIIMLPYFTKPDEVEKFVDIVGGRAKTMPLLESASAYKCIDEILDIQGLDEIFIGLNDLSLDLGKKFMFELLSDGIVEELCLKFRRRELVYGFGGIAAIGTGILPAEAILKEHYRLGSTSVILSRSFCNYERISDLKVIEEKFNVGIRSLRSFEKEIELHSRYFEENKEFVKKCISEVIKR